MRFNVTASTLLELVGLVLILVAAFALDWRAGVAVIGLVLLLAGFVLGGSEDAAEAAARGDGG
jgi:hypothetical protein